MNIYKKFALVIAIAILTWKSDSGSSVAFSASSLSDIVTCDNELIDPAIRDGPIQITLTNGYLSTGDGRFLYRFLPADGENVIPYDNAIEPEYLRDVIRYWIPLCGDPQKTSDISGSFKRVNRGSPSSELGYTDRKYRQINYEDWPLYYFDGDLGNSDNAQAPLLWDLVPENILERKGKSDTGGNKYNAGP
jgi:hypothetical protein